MARIEIINHKILGLKNYLKKNGIEFDFDYSEKWGLEVTMKTPNATESGLSINEVFGS